MLALVAGMALAALTHGGRHRAPRASTVPRTSVQTPGQPVYQAPGGSTATDQWSFAFVPGTTTLTAASRPSVDAVATTLRRDPTLGVRVTGYAERPTERSLAESRARSVKASLEQQAVDGERVIVAVSDAREPGRQAQVGAELISR
jgi:outer membrane protein OmpA-like peptidoglycan-associated protein